MGKAQGKLQSGRLGRVGNLKRVVQWSLVVPVWVDPTATCDYMSSG